MADGSFVRFLPRMAFDKSVRTVGPDGYLHIEVSNISKANVCPYLGSEIPDAEGLGLEPSRVYQLLRDPEELTKAADTFNNLPLLSKHVPVSADSFPEELVVGSTGTDAAFVAPYLKNSLVVWKAVAIAGIETDEQRELSSAYRYIADMTPGEYEGVKYDGVMRNIIGNHVALVETGRAGSDVVVGDNLPTELEITMSKAVMSRKALLAQGALATFLKPKLAADAKIDLAGILGGVTRENWAKQKPSIATAIQAKTKGKLAQDADLDDVVALLDTLDAIESGEATDDDLTPEVVDPADVGMDDDMMGKVMEFLKGKLSEDDMKACEALMKPEGAQDEPPATPGTPKKPDDDVVSKPAMDRAIKAAVDQAEARTVARMNGIADAKVAVRPHVGEITAAMDSAAAVYRLALDAAKVDHEGIDDAAVLGKMVKMLPLPGAAPKPRIAQDAGSKDFATRYPEAGRLKSH